jgi:hypothetical protein
LFHSISVQAGGGQTVTVATPLPAPIQVNVSNPYTGQPNVGATVAFSDACTKPGSSNCGTFSPGNGTAYGTGSVTTETNGNASISYAVPSKAGTYTLTATLMVNGVASGSVTTTATATAGAATIMIPYGGGQQTGSDGFNLPKPIIVEIEDSLKNPVNGVTVTFAATKGGIPNPASVVTGTNGIAGMAYTLLQLPNSPTPLTVTATAPGPNGTTLKGNFSESSKAPIPTKLGITNGNYQAGTPSAQLPQALSVMVSDQYGNPVSGNSVTFTDNGAGGTFSNGPTVVTGSNGIASEFYTLPQGGSAVGINATATGIGNSAAFSEYLQ